MGSPGSLWGIAGSLSSAHYDSLLPPEDSTPTASDVKDSVYRRLPEAQRGVGSYTINSTSTAPQGSLLPSSEACGSLGPTACALCFPGLSTKTWLWARFPGHPRTTYSTAPGDSSPSGVCQCCFLTPSFIRKVWAGEQISSPDPCPTPRGTLGKSLVLSPRLEGIG